MKKLFQLSAKAFYNLKIRQKTFILIVFTALFSISIVFVTTYSIYSKSEKAKVQQYNYSIIGQMIKNIDSYFLSLQNIAYSLMYNPDLQSYIVATNKSPYELSQQEKFIKNALRYYYHSQIDIQICMFLESDVKNFFTMTSYVNNDYNYKEDEWYKLISESNESRVIVLNNPQKYYASSERKPVYSIVYRMMKSDSLNTLGYIVIDVSRDQFSKFFQTEYVDVIGTQILSSSRQPVYGRPTDAFMQDRIAASLPEEKTWGYYDISIGSQEYMAVFGTSEYTGWRIVNVVSYKELLKELAVTRNIYILITIIVILITLATSYGFSRLITNPIVRLKRAMDKVKSGDFLITVKQSSRDEIGDLVGDFNSMTQKIDRLMKENASAELLKREAELKALQQQINPHFLYNTLEMVIGAASEGNSEQVAFICKSLGNMLRYNLNFKKDEFFENEIKQVQNYANIMEQRFEGRFRICFDIDPDVLLHRTVKFTLQPFIENSIMHGFKHTVHGGLLDVSVLKSEGYIRICIKDNGCGFSGESLRVLQMKLQQEMDDLLENIDRQDNLGIMNVHMRLKLFFGEQYTFSIESVRPQGTAVTIKIPAI